MVSWTLLLVWLTLFFHTLQLFSTLYSHFTSESDLAQAHSFLDQTHNPSSPQQESYLLSTLSKKWLDGWIITVNTIYIQSSIIHKSQKMKAIHLNLFPNSLKEKAPPILGCFLYYRAHFLCIVWAKVGLQLFIWNIVQ